MLSFSDLLLIGESSLRLTDQTGISECIGLKGWSSI
jgi:hypothetical protein